MRTYPAMVAAAALVLAGALSSGPAEAATAEMKNGAGATVGRVRLMQSPHGVLLRVSLTGVAPGTHGFHIHAAGKCVPPFKSAKGHFNPSRKKHGLMNPAGKHAGDLPNIHVPPSGRFDIEILVPAVTLLADSSHALFDANGSAIVIHEGPDDYRTDPAGAAGPRIACGVIR